jgi:ketosteroid isomerase-like protein
VTTPSAVVGDVARAIDGRDWDALEALLDEGFRCTYVHTGEVLDRAAYVALNRDYPGAWRFEPVDEVVAGDRACALARVSDGGETHHVAMFLTVRDGRVSELVEVWAELVEPVAERRPAASGG